MAKRKKRIKGVPVKYKAYWRYKGVWKETKVKPGTWKLSFRATKNRKAKSYGSHPKGRRIRWKFTGYQDVIKTDKGKYQTHLYGTKRLVKASRGRLK